LDQKLNSQLISPLSAGSINKENCDTQIVSDESIVKEEEMKKVKVLDYHFHSDSSRKLSQLMQPMQSADLSHCFVDQKEADKEREPT